MVLCLLHYCSPSTTSDARQTSSPETEQKPRNVRGGKTYCFTSGITYRYFLTWLLASTCNKWHNTTIVGLKPNIKKATRLHREITGFSQDITQDRHMDNEVMFGRHSSYPHTVQARDLHWENRSSFQSGEQDCSVTPQYLECQRLNL